MTDANVRRTQWIFLAVMVFSLAQMVWWLYDQSHQSRLVLEREMELFSRDEAAAAELLERGMTPPEIEEIFPHLQVFEAAGRVDSSALAPPRHVPKVRPELIAELYEERRSHLNQYTWEGGFFLLVLLTSMLVVWQALRREARLGRWQENFLAAVTHELKSPIASLQLAAETLALRRLKPEKEEELVGRILADTERLGVTVANVIDTHRLDQGAVSHESSVVELRAAVSEALSEIEYRAADTGIELRHDVPGDLRVATDRQALRSVLRNLLDNALKAQTGASAEARDEILLEEGETPPARGRIEISARLDTSGGEDRVLLEVADDGIGFDAEESGLIFQKFYRIGDEMRRRSPGSGLGLHLCRSLVELDGGTIRAESDGAGRGARFVLSWPQTRRME